MRRLWSSIAGVVAVAAIVIGINLFADARLANIHIDLTQGHIYTLSPGTRKVLSSLKEPVTLRLFYSRALGSTVPVYGSYADHVREMLANYAAVSGGKVRVWDARGHLLGSATVVRGKARVTVAVAPHGTTKLLVTFTGKGFQPSSDVVRTHLR